jgi:hypothetical protein
MTNSNNVAAKVATELADFTPGFEPGIPKVSQTCYSCENPLVFK